VGRAVGLGLALARLVGGPTGGTARPPGVIRAPYLGSSARLLYTAPQRR
jgi:hypothetical protein